MNTDRAPEIVKEDRLRHDSADQLMVSCNQCGHRVGERFCELRHQTRVRRVGHGKRVIHRVDQNRHYVFCEEHSYYHIEPRREPLMRAHDVRRFIGAFSYFWLWPILNLVRKKND